MIFRLTALLLAFIAGAQRQPPTQQDAPDHVLGACAVFASDGTSAAASVYADRLLLEIAHHSEKNVRLPNLHLRFPVDEQPDGRVTYSCRAYIDQRSELVAVGISRFSLLNTYPLRVAVANLETDAWIGDWGVEQSSGIREPILSGFLEGTTSLAVTGVAARLTRYGMGNF